MARTAENGSPSGYGREKLAMLRARMTTLGPLLDRFVPIAFRGVDPVQMKYALMGFTGFSTGWTENTTDGDAEQSFHEVGLFQVPAGPRVGPAPNTNPAADDNAYGRIALAPRGDVYGDLARTMLNRSASTEHNAWKPSSSTSTSQRDVRAREDQVAIGLVNLIRDEASLRTMLNRAQTGVAGDANGWSLWRVFCMFTAFSRGANGAFTRIGGKLNVNGRDTYPYLARLAAVPENQRLHAYLAMVDQDIQQRAQGLGALKGRSGSAYGIIRSAQKLYCGRELAQATNGPVGFFDPILMDAAMEDRLTRTAYGLSVTSVVESAATTVSSVASIAAQAVTDESLGPKIGAAIVLFIAAASGVVYATRN